MCLSEVKSLKHELRTPVNHIIGYSELLRETAEDTTNDFLAEQASILHSLGSELNKVIERTLLFSDQNFGVQDIQAIKDAIGPLAARIKEGLALCLASEQEDAPLADLKRIQSAVDRLQAILDASLLPKSLIERIPS